MEAWPRRRSWRRSSGELAHGVGAYRTQSANTGGRSGLLGRWWCYCGDEWAARRELALAMATVEAGKSSAAAAGEEETEKMQMVHAGQCGRVLARLRRALACLGHTRRGTVDAQRPLASTRRADSVPVGHRRQRFISSVKQWSRLTARVDDDFSAKL